MLQCTYRLKAAAANCYLATFRAASTASFIIIIIICASTITLKPAVAVLVSQLTGLVVCLGACVHPQSTHTQSTHTLAPVEMHGFITLAVFADT